MRINIILIMLSGLFAIAPSALQAHISDTGSGLSGVLLHPFTGIDHILMMVLVGVVIVYYIIKRSRQGE